MRCTTTGIGRTERCSCVHRARNRLSPSRFTAGSNVDRSSAACSMSTNPRPVTADQGRGRVLTPDRWARRWCGALGGRPGRCRGLRPSDDKLGHRVLTIPPQWVCAVVLAIIGLWAGAPPAVVLGLFLVFSFFSAVYNTLAGVYPGEVLPPEIRGVGPASRPRSAGSALGWAPSCCPC